MICYVCVAKVKKKDLNDLTFSKFLVHPRIVQVLFFTHKNLYNSGMNRV